MEPFPLRITIGEKYAPAMEITDQAAADDYFAACVEHNLRSRAAEGLMPDRPAAERVERANLGYYAGYYGPETRERVERLFRCAHPVFGAIADRGGPTPEEALRLGIEAGRKAREST